MGCKSSKNIPPLEEANQSYQSIKSAAVQATRQINYFLLDLDHTLLVREENFNANLAKPMDRLSNTTRFTGNAFECVPIRFRLPNGRTITIHFRNGLNQLLELISTVSNAQVVFVTRACYLYAIRIKQFIVEQLARNGISLKISLRCIPKNRPKSFHAKDGKIVMIVDDRPQVWSTPFHPHIIRVEPFKIQDIPMSHQDNGLNLVFYNLVKIMVLARSDTIDNSLLRYHGIVASICQMFGQASSFNNTSRYDYCRSCEWYYREDCTSCFQEYGPECWDSDASSTVINDNDSGGSDTIVIIHDDNDPDDHDNEEDDDEAAANEEEEEDHNDNNNGDHDDDGDDEEESSATTSATVVVVVHHGDQQTTEGSSSQSHSATTISSAAVDDHDYQEDDDEAVLVEAGQHHVITEEEENSNYSNNAAVEDDDSNYYYAHDSEKQEDAINEGKDVDRCHVDDSFIPMLSMVMMMASKIEKLSIKSAKRDYNN